MQGLYRSKVNKHRSAKTFRKQQSRTKGANFRVMRGGIRF